MLQTLSPKAYYYCVTSRLPSVRTVQPLRGQNLITIYRCEATTSRCVHRSDFRDAAWRCIELQCAHFALHHFEWQTDSVNCSDDEFNH
jgi:hypothetical protein